MAHATITVNDLRVLIADLPGEMFVLVPGGDHEYFMASVGVADVWREDPKRGPPQFAECNNEGSTNDQAFVVGR